MIIDVLSCRRCHEARDVEREALGEYLYQTASINTSLVFYTWAPNGDKLLIDFDGPTDSAREMLLKIRLAFDGS